MWSSTSTFIVSCVLIVCWFLAAYRQHADKKGLWRFGLIELLIATGTGALILAFNFSPNFAGDIRGDAVPEQKSASYGFPFPCYYRIDDSAPVEPLVRSFKSVPIISNKGWGFTDASCRTMINQRRLIGNIAFLFFSMFSVLFISSRFFRRASAA